MKYECVLSHGLLILLSAVLPVILQVRVSKVVEFLDAHWLLDKIFWHTGLNGPKRNSDYFCKMAELETLQNGKH